MDCTPDVARELSDYFTFDAPGAKFMPAFRHRHWDGKIRLFKMKGHTIYKGLIPRIKEFAADRGYQCLDHVGGTRFGLLSVWPTVTDWLSTIDLPNGRTPRSYQIDALDTCLGLQRGIIQSPTGSGKSLIIHLLHQMFDQYPVLIVVPTINLVTQMCEDFKSYGLDTDRSVHLISGGREKVSPKSICISTWQSIFEQDDTYFNKFKMVIVDEVHLAKAKSLSGLMEKCTQVPLRFGFTGTLDDTLCHRLILEGLFGTIRKVATTDELVQSQHLAPLKVKLCVLEYPKAVCKSLRHATYPDEIEYLVTNPARDAFITQLVSHTKGNTLVLFQYVEKHGIQLVERIRQATAGRKEVHYIDGSIDAVERERIRQAVELGDNQILVASYGTTSLGVNITNLRTLVFASPSKSKYRVLQSIGRALRMSEGKSHATLVDIVDDLRIGKHVNFVFQHAQQRIEYYSTEKFPYTLHQYPLSQAVALKTGLEALGLTNPTPSDTQATI